MASENQRCVLLLLRLLCERTDENHYVSVSDILQYWENEGVQAGRKSIYGDIQLLFDMGWDIICVKSTQNRYFIGSRMFELPELKLLVDAVKSSHFITEKKSVALIEKLEKLTGVYNAENLNRPIYRPIYMDGTVKQDNETIYYAIDTIQTAILNQRTISFQYYEYTQNKDCILRHNGYRYVVSPYDLIWNRDFYYMVGWSEKHSKLTQFRVDRMTAIANDKKAAYIENASFAPAIYLREVFWDVP